MPVLVQYDAFGDTNELLVRYDATGKEIEGEHPPGVLATICVPTADGIRVFVLMESDDNAGHALTAATEANRQSRVRDAVHRGGLVPEQRTTNVMPVYALSIHEDAPALVERMAAER